MARGPITVPIASETGAFEKGIRSGVIDPVEDAEKALNKLGKTKGPDKLTDELEQAQKATDKLGDEIKDTTNKIEDAFRRTYKKVGDSSKEGTDRAREGVEELGDEAKSTAKEAAASFDGSAESIIDAFQEVAANAFAGFGPAGVLAGLAIAGGIGIAVGEFEKAAEAAEELRTKAIEYADQAREAGVSTEAWVTGAQRLVERIRELEEAKSTDFRWFWEDDPSKLEKWTDALGDMGRDADEVNTVLSASDDVLESYTKSLRKSQDALMDEIQLRRETVDISNEAEVAKTQALVDEYEAHQEVLDQIKEETTLRGEAADSHARQSAAGIDAALAQAEAEEEKANRIASAQEAVQDSVTSAYDNMRGAASEFATSEDGALDIGRWLTYTQEHAAAVATYQANLQAMKLTPEQWSNLMEMPESTRSQWVAQFVAMPEEARAPYAAALNDLGSNGGSEAAVGFEDSFDPDAGVEIDVDSSVAQADLDRLAEDRTATIEVKTTGKADAKADLDDLAKKRSATINVRADMSDASATIRSWRSEQSSRPVYINVIPRVGKAQLT